MSDQDQQAPDETVTDTPEQHDEPSVNWEERYQNLQPEYTRASQEAAKYRGLVERAQAGDPEAARELGFELAEDTDEGEQSDEFEPEVGETQADYDRRIAALEAKLTEREERDAEREHQDRVNIGLQHIADALTELKVTDEDEQALISDLAFQMPPNEHGLPDIKSAYARLTGRDTQAQKRWAGTKQTSAVSPVGQAGTQQIAVSEMTDEQRVAFMTQRARDLES